MGQCHPGIREELLQCPASADPLSPPDTTEEGHLVGLVALCIKLPSPQPTGCCPAPSHSWLLDTTPPPAT